MKTKSKKFGSALAELRCTTCALQTVLLSLLHSGVAGHETGSLQSGTELGVQGDQCAGDAVTDSAGLTGNAAACDGNNNINLTNQVGGDQGLTDDQLQGLQAKVIVDITAIDGDSAGAVLVNANTGNGGLTTASAVVILSLAFVQYQLPPISPESRRRAAEQRACALRPCTGADGPCSCGPGCSWAACP